MTTNRSETFRSLVRPLALDPLASTDSLHSARIRSTPTFDAYWIRIRGNYPLIMYEPKYRFRNTKLVSSYALFDWDVPRDCLGTSDLPVFLANRNEVP